MHQRQRRFRLQDHMYYIKVVLKNPTATPPLLSELLQLFQEGFHYIFSNLSTFYNPEDHNIAFLTLYQEPMINALNTGGFDLQDNINEMIERILKMLQQFLISNNSLRLNSSFKVYVKVMSIDHMKYKRGLKKKKNPKKKYGIRSINEENINNYWSLNVPDGFDSKPNVFKNKCLLTSTILGHLQNVFYQSNRKDKRFVYVQNINSKIKAKKIHGCKILLNELNKLLSSTNISNEGPYDVDETTKQLSVYYKCQFFIFDSIDNSNKLCFMYPEDYDDSLEPIYLFQPLNSPNHVVFIRHLNSYFKANLKICFYCKKSFRSYRYNHFCPKIKGCFACHRPFAKKSTFLHEKNKINFCDKKITSELAVNCKICNVVLYSKHCSQGHKLLCYGKGSFGWKCLKCNKFCYRYGKMNSKMIENAHQCGSKKCIYCYEDADSQHLCKLKIEKFPKTWPLLAFIGIEHCTINIENCLDCLQIKKEFQEMSNLSYKDLTLNSTYLSLCCEKHKSSNILIEPTLIIIYKETKRGHFTKYVLTNNSFISNDYIETDHINFEYVSKELSYLYDKKSNECKSQRKTFDFNKNLKLLRSKDKSTLTLIDKFVQLISNAEWQYTTFVSQDSNSQNYNTILSAFLENGFCPRVIQNGRKILFMEVESFCLRFITSNSYLEGTENEIAQQFNLQTYEYFFPESLKIPCYFNYQGNVPNVENFYSFSDNYQTKIKKKQFVEELTKKRYVWNYEKELIRFCDEKLFMMTMACLKFLEESFTFQILIKDEQNISSKELLHPFGFHICSMPGFTFKLFKICYLNYEDVYIVKNEYGTNTKNVSKIEYEWASFMEFKYPECNFLSAFNNPLGQQYFKEAIPDLYSPITKEAHFLHGCKWHGHLNECLLDPNATEESKNPVGVTYKTLNENFFTKASNLLQNNPEKVHKVTIHWECLYLEKRQNELMQFFLRNVFKPHPLQRLCPRSCVRGAYTDVYALKWSKSLFPSEDFYFFDVNSLYSYVAITYPFFTSKYEVLMGKDLDNITYDNEKNSFFYNGKKMFGTMLVTILPPRKLYVPYLLLKTTSGKSINTLCSKCCETYSTQCTHIDEERAITDSFFISEIVYAIKQNYKLLYIHECHNYESVKYILKDFVQKVNVLKLQNSNCLSECTNENEKEEYCNYLNSLMGLEFPFSLNSKNVLNNRSKRNFFKLMANGLFGKFSQKQNKFKTLFASNQQELEKIYFSDAEIKDIFCLNDKICQVQIKPNDFKLPPDRKGNCYIGGQITAYAREIMHDHLMSVLRNGGTLYQTDTDSICFSLPKNHSIPLLVSHCIGHFKNEIDGEIESFHSLGSKNYSIVYKKNNMFFAITKIRGLSLKSSVNQNLINDEVFDDFLIQFKNSNACKKKISQSRFKRLKNNRFQVHPHIEQITFSNDVSNKRYVDFSVPNYVTFPYGY
jgi:hypothetical protein